MLLQHLIDSAGFTENEAKVYLAGLGLGNVLASTLARKAMINRSSIYSITSSLIQKGLMGMIIINNVTYFYSSDPEALLDIKTNQIKDHKAQFKNLHLILPDLMLLKKKSEENHSNVCLYRGMDILHKMYNKIMNVKDTPLFSVLPNEDSHNASILFSKELNVARIAHNIFHKVLVTSQNDQICKNSSDELLEKRYINLYHQVVPASIMHFHDNKIYMINTSPQTETIVMESPSCFDMMIKVFSFLWNLGKR